MLTRIRGRSATRTGWFESRTSRPGPARGTLIEHSWEDEMSAIQTPQAAPRETIAFDELGRSFRGELLLPTSTGYDTARRIWNGAIDRRPACIARCAGVADVVAAVRFAREHDLEIAVRG